MWSGRDLFLMAFKTPSCLVAVLIFKKDTSINFYKQQKYILKARFVTFTEIYRHRNAKENAYISFQLYNITKNTIYIQSRATHKEAAILHHHTSTVLIINVDTPDVTMISLTMLLMNIYQLWQLT